MINQIRGFLLEHGIAIRQGPAGLRQALPSILAHRVGELSPLLLRLLEDLIDDWRQLDRRIEAVRLRSKHVLNSTRSASA